MHTTVEPDLKLRAKKWRILEPGTNFGASCLECNVEIPSDFCWISHKANVCHRRVQCVNCKKLVYYSGLSNGGMKKANTNHYGYWKKMKQLVLKTHVCQDETIFCQQCLTSHKKNESCRMHFKKLEPPISNICYVSYAMVSNDYKISCYECYNIGQKCDLHKRLKPYNMCNALTTLRKTMTTDGQMCTSKEYIWNFENETCDFGQTTSHWELDVMRQLPSNSGMAKTNYNATKKNRGLIDIAKVNPTDTMEFFIKEALTEKEFCNTIIIGHGRKFLFLVNKALLKMSIQPTSLRKNQSLIRLISNTNNLNFLAVDSFLPMDFKSLYEEEKGVIFYPFPANHPELYDLKTLPRNYFISIEDSKPVIARKENFFLDFQNSDQTLKELLTDYLQTELTYLSNLCLKMEETVQRFQYSLQSSEKLKEFPIASIFSHPTLASFFYAILTNYTLRFHEDFELFTINNSEKGVYNGRTSKKEFQYQGRS